MVISRTEIVAEAVSWIGTPWHHHQSCKGAGTDCVGLLFGVGKAVGAIPGDAKLPNYERLARGKYLIEQLEKWLNKTDLVLPGNVVLLRCGGLDTHVGIITGTHHFVHASSDLRRVDLGSLDEHQSKVVALYCLKGVV